MSEKYFLKSKKTSLDNDVYAYNKDANFERVRRALGGLTEAAFNGSETTVLQQKSSDGDSVSLKIYSKADKVFVDGKELSKVGDCFSYSKSLSDGRNSVKIKYVLGDEEYSFEYFLANKLYHLTVADLAGASVVGTGNPSALEVVGNVFDIKAVSYGGNNSKKLDFVFPIDVDYQNVNDFGFTLKNKCAEQIYLEIYLKTARNVLVDKIALYPYETYQYNSNHFYEKSDGVSGIQGVILRFTNYNKDAYGNFIPLADRTLEVYDFNYSLR